MGRWRFHASTAALYVYVYFCLSCCLLDKCIAVLCVNVKNVCVCRYVYFTHTHTNTHISQHSLLLTSYKRLPLKPYEAATSTLTACYTHTNARTHIHTIGCHTHTHTYTQKWRWDGGQKRKWHLEQNAQRLRHAERQTTKMWTGRNSNIKLFLSHTTTHTHITQGFGCAKRVCGGNKYKRRRH